MQLAAELFQAKRIVFLTGAGVSTPSGIPDYRSKGGLYDNDQQRPEYLLSHTCLVHQPEKFYQFVVQQMYYPAALPNIIHQKMAWFTQNKAAIIITQNVDGLHMKAKAQNVIEFHGSLYRVYCQKCGQKVAYQQYLKSMIHQGCGGILRPAIVLYEEQIDPKIINASLMAISQADLIVVCGTSLQVYPFAGLLTAADPTAKIIAINREKLVLPANAQQIVADAASTFAAVKV